MDEAVNENFKAERCRRLRIHCIRLTPVPGRRCRPGRRSTCRSRTSRSRIERVREPRRRGYWVPRAAIFTGAAVLTAAFAHELFSILAFVVITPVQFLFLILSTIAFGWIAVGSLSAALGFLPLFAGEHPDTIEPPSPSCRSSRERRCCFPSITRSRRGSREPSRLWRASYKRWARTRTSTSSSCPTRAASAGGRARPTSIVPWREHLEDVLPVYYRRRRENHGAQIRQHRRLGATLRRRLRVLRHSRRRQRHVRHDAGAPGARHGGRSQGRPHPDRAAARRRRHAAAAPAAVRLQRLRPAVAAGLAFWHRDQGNYWGHNAIIRTAAFAAAAGLPTFRAASPSAATS